MPRLPSDTYRAVFENSLDAILLADDGANLVEVNAAAVRVTGFSRDELLRMRVFDLPTDELQVETHALWMAFIARGEQSGPFNLRRKDGTCIRLHYRATANVAPGLHASILRDLTRSDTRASIQYAVSRSLADRDGLDTAAPEFIRQIADTLDWAYGALWLRDSEADVLHCAHVWTSDLVPAAGAFARRMPQTFRPGEALPGRVYQTREPIWLNAPDGDIRFPTLETGREAGLRTGIAVPIEVGTRTFGALEFFSVREEPRDDRLIETLHGIGHQIGQYIERRAAERAEANAARAANQLKDEFLAVLSHELRTPLNAILGWTRLLRSGHMDDAARARALEIVERNVQSQTQIVDDLLDVSRIITGKLRLDVQPVDLAEIVQDVLESIRPAVDAKGLEIAFTRDSPGRVSGDPNRLQQVVWNLLTNAIKFTPRGGHVAADVTRVDDHVRLTVRDTGAGIASELLPRVFDRFLQADSSTTRQHGGLGLGLAIVRHLVELHGGVVDAQSPGAGKGSEFRVLLPALDAAIGRPIVQDDRRGETDGASGRGQEEDHREAGIAEQRERGGHAHQHAGGDNQGGDE